MTNQVTNLDAEMRAELRALAVELAQVGGSIAVEGRRGVNRNDEHIGGDTKSSQTDIVTEFDRAAEAAIVDILRTRRSADAIVGEEGASVSGTSGFSWFIDPIDGTTNYVYDQPAWSCSVAVAYHGEMIAGAVAVPILDELFEASLGDGAWRNGSSISASSVTDLSLALVGTGFSYQAATRTQQALRLAQLIANVRDIRRLGSAAVDLCFVACGRLDVYYETGLNAWDAAAGELIARESGAITSDFSGGPAFPAEMLVAAPGLHQQFLAALSATNEPA